MKADDRDPMSLPAAGCPPEFLQRLKDHPPTSGLDHAPDGEELPPLQEGSEIGGYRLVRLLGRGGMGVVWMAEEQFTQRVVALKLISPKLLGDRPDQARAEAVRRFRQELQTAARLEHLNIVPVYHAGEVAGRLFYSMQYVAGMSPLEAVTPLRPTAPWTDATERTTLPQATGAVAVPHRWRRRWARRPQSPRLETLSWKCRETAARYVEQAARGVAYAHARGYIHRDIKPDNILIERPPAPADGPGWARVMDFGLAKALRSDDDRDAIPQAYRAGTYGYMAPEQSHDAGRATVRSDVFSLGATLCALLTGKPPARPAQPGEPLSAVLTGLPVRLDRELEAVCLRCLHRDPDDRYATADELADDLHRFRLRQPVHARYHSWWEHYRLFQQREPARAWLLSGAVLLLIVAAVCAALLANQALAEFRRAEAKARQQEFATAADQAEYHILGDLWRSRAAEETAGQEAVPEPQRNADLETGIALAQDAVRRYGSPATGTPKRDFDAAWLDAQQTRQLQGRYADLLFLLAVGGERLSQNGADAEHRGACRLAVQLLDAAESLGAGSQVLYRQRATFQAVLGNPAEADQQRATRTPLTTFYDHLFEAARLRGGTDFEAENTQYNLALAKRPGEFWTLYRHATCLERAARRDGDRNLLAQAESVLRACLVLRPGDASVHNNRGRMLQDLGRPEAAAAEYENAIRGHPDYLMAYTNLMHLYAESGDPAAAAATYARLLRRNPPTPVQAKALNRLGMAHERARDLAQALACYEQAIAVEPSDASSLRNGANALVNLDRAAEAERVIERAVQAQPDVADLRYIRGNILAAQHRYPEAIAAFTAALERDPQHAAAWYNRGVVRRRIQDYAAARADQAEVLKLRGYDRDAVYEQAMNQIGQQQWREAASTLDQILARNGDDVEALVTRAKALGDRGTEEDWKSSELDLTLVIRNNPQHADAYRTRGLTRFRRRDWNGAVQDWLRYLELEPTAADAWQIHDDLGNAYLALRSDEPARKHYQLSIELQPQPSNLTNHANALLQQGDLTGALPDCEAALRMQPNDPRALALRGQIQLRRGRWAEAEDDLDRSFSGHALYETRLLQSVARFWLGRRETLLDDVAAVANEAPEGSARRSFARGFLAFLQDRRPESAIEELSQARQDPVLGRFALALRGLAWAELGGGGLQAAAEDAERLAADGRQEALTQISAARIYARIARRAPAAESRQTSLRRAAELLAAATQIEPSLLAAVKDIPELAELP